MASIADDEAFHHAYDGPWALYKFLELRQRRNPLFLPRTLAFRVEARRKARREAALLGEMRKRGLRLALNIVGCTDRSSRARQRTTQTAARRAGGAYPHQGAGMPQQNMLLPLEVSVYAQSRVAVGDAAEQHRLVDSFAMQVPLLRGSGPDTATRIELPIDFSPYSKGCVLVFRVFAARGGTTLPRSFTRLQNAAEGSRLASSSSSGSESDASGIARSFAPRPPATATKTKKTRVVKKTKTKKNKTSAKRKREKSQDDDEESGDEEQGEASSNAHKRTRLENGTHAAGTRAGGQRDAASREMLVETNGHGLPTESILRADASLLSPRPKGQCFSARLQLFPGSLPPVEAEASTGSSAADATKGKGQEGRLLPAGEYDCLLSKHGAAVSSGRAGAGAEADSSSSLSSSEEEGDSGDMELDGDVAQPKVDITLPYLNFFVSWICPPSPSAPAASAAAASSSPSAAATASSAAAGRGLALSPDSAQALGSSDIQAQLQVCPQASSLPASVLTATDGARAADDQGLCKCGSTTHRRTNHKDCSLNPKNKTSRRKGRGGKAKRTNGAASGSEPRARSSSGSSSARVLYSDPALARLGAIGMISAASVLNHNGSSKRNSAGGSGGAGAGAGGGGERGGSSAAESGDEVPLVAVKYHYMYRSHETSEEADSDNDVKLDAKTKTSVSAAADDGCVAHDILPPSKSGIGLASRRKYAGMTTFAHKNGTADKKAEKKVEHNGTAGNGAAGGSGAASASASASDARSKVKRKARRSRQDSSTMLLRRRTEVRHDLKCPWCGLAAGSIDGLVHHVVSSHDRLHWYMTSTTKMGGPLGGAPHTHSGSVGAGTGGEDKSTEGGASSSSRRSSSSRSSGGGGGGSKAGGFPACEIHLSMLPREQFDLASAPPPHAGSAGGGGAAAGDGAASASGTGIDAPALSATSTSADASASAARNEGGARNSMTADEDSMKNVKPWQQPFCFRADAGTERLRRGLPTLPDFGKLQSSFLRERRVYYHSRFGEEVSPGEIAGGIDSDDDVKEDWIIDQNTRRLDEFEDVAIEEKSLMSLWNLHTSEFEPFADVYAPFLCLRFCYKYGEQLVKEPNGPALRNNLVLHLFNMYDFGVIDKETIDRCLAVMDQHARVAAAAAPEGLSSSSSSSNDDSNRTSTSTHRARTTSASKKRKAGAVGAAAAAAASARKKGKGRRRTGRRSNSRR